VNTALMRCLTKGLALHGLGLYIYAGEDLPEAEPVKVMPVDQSTGEIKAEVKMDTGSDEANAKLFAEGMIKYSSLVKDLKDLNSYWKANQGQLDKLKTSHPELYENVRNTFAHIKLSFQPKE
jgi:soluble cytochrome b562